MQFSKLAHAGALNNETRRLVTKHGSSERNTLVESICTLKAADISLRDGLVGNASTQEYFALIFASLKKIGMFNENIKVALMQEFNNFHKLQYFSSSLDILSDPTVDLLTPDNLNVIKHRGATAISDENAFRLLKEKNILTQENFDRIIRIPGIMQADLANALCELHAAHLEITPEIESLIFEKYDSPYNTAQAVVLFHAVDLPLHKHEAFFQIIFNTKMWLNTYYINVDFASVVCTLHQERLLDVNKERLLEFYHAHREECGHILKIYTSQLQTAGLLTQENFTLLLSQLPKYLYISYTLKDVFEALGAFKVLSQQKFEEIFNSAETDNERLLTTLKNKIENFSELWNICRVLNEGQPSEAIEANFQTLRENFDKTERIITSLTILNKGGYHNDLSLNELFMIIKADDPESLAQNMLQKEKMSSTPGLFQPNNATPGNPEAPTDKPALK
jgi:hypothetical protein